MNAQLILTCEHAGNRVPAAYRSLFRDAADVLASHRGWDPGALALARAFQRRLATPLFYSSTTRLLVELNRSIGHRALFSKFSAGLDDRDKQQLLRKHYHPYRNRVESWIGDRLENQYRVVHLSLHTFTPQLDAKLRNADLGLLYDPQRETEKALCNRWHSTLTVTRPDLRIRRNYPYLGHADGFTTYLRRRFPAGYAGVELEVNQTWSAKSKIDWRRLREDLSASFAAVWDRA